MGAWEACEDEPKIVDFAGEGTGHRGSARGPGRGLWAEGLENERLQGKVRVKGGLGGHTESVQDGHLRPDSIGRLGSEGVRQLGVGGCTGSVPNDGLRPDSTWGLGSEGVRGLGVGGRTGNVPK